MSIRTRFQSTIIILIFINVFLLKNSVARIIVEPGGKISSIRTALSLAEDGDTLLVKKGYYRESDLLVDKKLYIIGENYPVLDGEGKSGILTITSDEVHVKGLIIQNAGVSFIEDNAGIKLDEVKYCVVADNRFINNFFSIYLAKTDSCRITGNTIHSSSERESTSGNGIHLWYSKNARIENNVITGHRDGIYLEFVEDSEIRGNISEMNLRYGLHFMFSNNCQYSQNTFRNNGAGVAVMYTKNVIMTENRFENNWGPASYGILLKDIRDSKIHNNTFYKNTIGLYTEASNRIHVGKNIFEGNGWAVKIMANSMDNVFSGNDFLNNSFDVATNSRQNFNKFSGNYWNKYKGYDLNRDGIGDVPFRPVRLFSIVVEKHHPAMILLNSFFISILETAESVFPVLTPETLIDDKPHMQRIL